ncbi:MAG: 4-hydroxy-3-methylbut-2-enyl diphosphate reductase [Candidatus Omnitrophota bacterium]
MEINIAKSSGFCFGVRRAINICKDLSGDKKPVYILGDIVHNTFVVQELAEKGVKKIGKIHPKKNSILVIRAHGAPKKTFGRAKKCGYKIVDATCPKVKDIYKIARRLEKGNKIIIIGDTGHDEVKGIAGQLKNKPVIIESPRKIPREKLKRVKKAAVITQSTQMIENINAVMKRLEKVIPEVRLYNTTCRTTVIKQQEIKSLPGKNDLVLIVGSPTSANTKRLYQIAKKINKKTHWIESAKDLKHAWFKRVKKVGIMAGASTPDRIVKQIVVRLKKEF